MEKQVFIKETMFFVRNTIFRRKIRPSPENVISPSENMAFASESMTFRRKHDFSLNTLTFHIKVCGKLFRLEISFLWKFQVRSIRPFHGI